MDNYQNKKYDKKTIENMPLGSCNLSIVSGYTIWATEHLAQRFLDYIINLVQQAIKIGLDGCKILRLTIITDNISTEVNGWSKQLGEEWRSTSEQAVGQTLTWGDGKFVSTYAVIIFSQQIALCLHYGTDEIKKSIYGMLFHELAHVHDNLYYLSLFGSEPQLQGNWGSYRKFLARSLWGEFFAEWYASFFYPEKFIDSTMSSFFDVLEKALIIINKEIKTYSLCNNFGNLRREAIYGLSSVLNQLGRSIGVIISNQQQNDSDQQIQNFLSEIKKIYPDWDNITYALFLILNESKLQLDQNLLEKIEKIVDDALQAFGLGQFVEMI